MAAHEPAPEHEADSHGAACGGELSDCANLDDINQSDRERELSPDLRIAWLAPPPTESALPDVLRPGSASCSADAARLAGSFPPLNVLYCVYLD
jgi:hypothetical protein